MFRVPRRTDTPAVSNARLSAAGLVSKKLVGDIVAVRMLAR